MIDRFLEGNRRFIEEDFSKDREYYRSLATGQKPTALFIACSDSRVNPERICGAKMGEIFVHRNIGNIVPKDDLNLATVLEYAVNHLKVTDIVVCGHSNCGAMKALDAGAENDTFIPRWLDYASDVKAEIEGKNLPKETAEELKARSREIELVNMRHQLDNLKSYDLVRKAIDEGRVQLHGLYYDLDTGTVSKVF
jgi:carbonic anhydrase